MELISLVLGITALIIALFVPGYFLCLGFFPGRTEIDLLERIVFSIIFSISFLALFILIENRLLGIPVNFISIVSTMLLLVLIGLITYFIRVRIIKLPQFFYVLFPEVEGEAFPLLPWK